MDLKDAVLVVLSEAADHPSVASIAQSAYSQLADGQPVDYRVLDELIGEVSGKGVLRDLHAKYSPTAYEAIISPILTEIGRHKPIRSGSRPSSDVSLERDPLTARVWPPR
jgi:hypothetical protein